MALQTLITTRYGIETNYHKVLETEICWHTRTATLIIGSFLNKTARIDGYDAIINDTVTISDGTYKGEGIFASSLVENPLFPFDYQRNVVEDAYLFLKSLSIFQNAIDV